MTLNSTTARNDYVGNGATSSYSYTFRITAASDLTVTKRDTAGVETTLALTTDYTVSGVGSGSGGTITLTAGALPSGYALTIRRVLPLTQPTDLRNQGPFLAETHETVFDRLTMIVQQLQDVITRSVRVSETNGPFNPLLPSTISQSGGKYLAVNTTGTAFDLIPQNAGTALTSPAITGTVSGGATYSEISLSGTVGGTYTLGGTPTIPASGLTGTMTSATQDLITRTGTLAAGTVPLARMQRDEQTAQNAAAVTVTSGGVTVATLPSMTVVAGDRIHVTARVTMTKGTTAGISWAGIFRTTVDATVVVGVDAVDVHDRRDQSASSIHVWTVSSIWRVTVGGTVTFTLQCGSGGSDGTVGIGDGDIYALVLKGT